MAKKSKEQRKRDKELRADREKRMRQFGIDIGTLVFAVAALESAAPALGREVKTVGILVVSTSGKGEAVPSKTRMESQAAGGIFAVGSVQPQLWFFRRSLCDDIDDAA